MSKTEWASQQGIHRVHLNAVLRGDRGSKQLVTKVDRFVANVEKRFRAKVGEAAA